MAKVPKPPKLAVPAGTAVKALVVPSTSLDVKLPVAVGVPAMALATPPASVTAPVLVPEITAASLLPVIVNTASVLDVLAARSITCTAKLSVALWLPVKAWVAALALFST